MKAYLMKLNTCIPLVLCVFMASCKDKCPPVPIYYERFTPQQLGYFPYHGYDTIKLSNTVDTITFYSGSLTNQLEYGGDRGENCTFYSDSVQEVKLKFSSSSSRDLEAGLGFTSGDHTSASPVIYIAFSQHIYLAGLFDLGRRIDYDTITINKITYRNVTKLYEVDGTNPNVYALYTIQDGLIGIIMTGSNGTWGKVK